jgi:hypothetical protein
MAKRKVYKAIWPSPLSQKWRLASSKVSIQAGPVRVRMEAAGVLTERLAIARAIALLPDVLPVFDRLLQFAETEGGTISDEEIENARTIIAALLGNDDAMKELGHG